VFLYHCPSLKTYIFMVKMTELIVFVFTDIDNRLGYFGVFDYVFMNYEQCAMYVENTLWNRQDIALTYCAPLDTSNKLSYDVHVITNW